MRRSNVVLVVLIGSLVDAGSQEVDPDTGEDASFYFWVFNPI